MTAPRKTLVLTNRLPFPLDDGWKQRTFHVIRALARSSETTLLTFHGGTAAQVDEFRAALGHPIEVLTVPPPRAYSFGRLVLGTITRRPVHVWNCASREYREALRVVTQRTRFDAAVAELTYMYPYLSTLPRTITRIVDTHNIDSLLIGRYADNFRSVWKRLYARITAKKLAAFEREVFADADHVWVCSDREAAQIRHEGLAENVLVAPNGVDVPEAPLRQDDRRPPRVVFCGHMSYYPNVDAALYFAEHVLPRLADRYPGLEFRVVGQSPDARLLDLARRDDRVHVTGRVEDVRPYIVDSTVVAVPLRAGGGTRLKILEALALGMPVVSTSIGAEGLEFVDGRDLLIADSAGAFTAAIERLIDDPAYARRLGQSGRAAVIEKYSWPSIESALGGQLVAPNMPMSA